MFELVPSACMRAYFKELHFEFTDFQKATLIWNAPNKSWKERLEALCELAETTEDANIRQQIHERMSFEQKKGEIFLNNDSGRYMSADSFRPDRFEFAFMKIPFDMQVGASVKDLATGRYYVLAQGKKEWDVYLQRIEANGWYVDYSDIQVIVYELTETGHWSHMHINPLYLDYEFPPYIEGDEVRNTLRRAMEAFGDYLHYMDCGKPKYADDEMVLRTAREYAETVRKQDCWYRRVQEAKKVEDIMF